MLDKEKRPKKLCSHFWNLLALPLFTVVSDFAGYILSLYTIYSYYVIGRYIWVYYVVIITFLSSMGVGGFCWYHLRRDGEIKYPLLWKGKKRKVLTSIGLVLGLAEEIFATENLIHKINVFKFMLKRPDENDKNPGIPSKLAWNFSVQTVGTKRPFLSCLKSKDSRAKKKKIERWNSENASVEAVEPSFNTSSEYTYSTEITQERENNQNENETEIRFEADVRQSKSEDDFKEFKKVAHDKSRDLSCIKIGLKFSRNYWTGLLHAFYVVSYIIPASDEMCIPLKEDLMDFHTSRQNLNGFLTERKYTQEKWNLLKNKECKCSYSSFSKEKDKKVTCYTDPWSLANLELTRLAPVASLFVVIMGMTWTIIHRDGRLFHLDLKKKWHIFLYYVLSFSAFYSKFLFGFYLSSIPATSSFGDTTGQGWNLFFVLLFGMMELWQFVLADRILLCLTGCKERKGTPVGQMLEDVANVSKKDLKKKLRYSKCKNKYLLISWIGFPYAMVAFGYCCFLIYVFGNLNSYAKPGDKSEVCIIGSAKVVWKNSVKNYYDCLKHKSVFGPKSKIWPPQTMKLVFLSMNGTLQNFTISQSHASKQSKQRRKTDNEETFDNSLILKSLLLLQSCTGIPFSFYWLYLKKTTIWLPLAVYLLHLVGLALLILFSISKESMFAGVFTPLVAPLAIFSLIIFTVQIIFLTVMIFWSICLCFRKNKK